VSYTFLVEQGEVSSAEYFSDIPVSALSKLNLTDAPFSCNANEMASSLHSQYGMPCKHLTQNHGVASSMLYAAASHVRTLVAPTTPTENNQDLLDSEADYGKRCLEWFAKFDPHLSGWKTRQLWLCEDWAQSLETWPQSGMMRDGMCFQAPILALHINENACSCLRTPMASDGLSWTRTNRNDVQVSIHKSLARGATYRTSYRFLWAQFTPRQCADYYETMMDWPLGWTELALLAMAKFQQWLLSHGIP